MRRWLPLWAALTAALPGRAVATHTEVLRSTGDAFTVSTWALALFAITTFLVVGAIIFLGFRYLYRGPRR